LYKSKGLDIVQIMLLFEHSCQRKIHRRQ